MCVCADEKYQLYLPRSLARSVQYSKPSRMLRSPRTVHVLGGGALGSLFAAHLSRAGCDTTLLLRPQRITGSHCTIRITEGDSHAGDSAMEQEMKVASSQTVAGSDHDHTTPFDMLVVATKAFDVRNALDGVRARLARTTSVILLCNGPLAVVDELPPHGGPLLVATSTHGAWSRAPRDVHHAGKGDTWVGPLTKYRRRARVYSHSAAVLREQWARRTRGDHGCDGATALAQARRKRGAEPTDGAMGLQ